MFFNYKTPDALEIIGDILEDFLEWEAFEADMAAGSPWD